MSNDVKKILHTIEKHVLSVAVVHLDHLIKNYRWIQKELSEKAQIAAVVKADAYGFGANQIAKQLYAEGCRSFFVATIGEGIDLRSTIDNDAKIFILSGFLSGTEALLLQHNLTPVLNNTYQADLWIDFAKKIDRKLNTVVHVDTGMFRNGFSQQDMTLYEERISSYTNVNFVMSHLSCADIPDHPMNAIQLNRFRDALHTFGNPQGSLSATNGIFLGKEYQFDIVRPGKGLYGFSIRKDKIGSLQSVMDVFARIVQVNNLCAGDTIGYGATFVADKNIKTVTVGMGYADGFMRKFAGFGHGFLGGKKLPVVGRISMDYMVLDASNVDDQHINIGDWVALTNSSDYTLEKWALELDTLPHEVSCRFGNRVKRIYVGGNI